MKFSSTKTIVINVLVTAVQGFLAAWAVTGNKTDKASLGAAVAAGASVAWNVVIKPALKGNGVL